MKKILLVVFSSFLFISCSGSGTDRNYIMGDSVKEESAKTTIVS